MSAALPHLAALLLLTFTLPGAAAHAQSRAVDTRVVVRVVSQDAKVLHDGVGGALVTIRDVETGHVLARGRQAGSSGSTDAIMRTPHARGAAVYDTPGTAAFTAVLALSRPTTVEVVGEGPLGHPHAMQRAARTLVLVPGEHVEGEGILLNLHGFIVELEDGGGAAEGRLPVRARVRMMCGCPTTPGGLWDSDGIDITARLLRDGAVVAEAPLEYAGEESTYEGVVSLPADRAGLVLQVLARDAAHANFGLAERPID